MGGGIIGTAAARQLKLIKPSLNIALVEKENEFGIKKFKILRLNLGLNI